MSSLQIDLAPDTIQQFCQKWQIRELSLFGSVLRDDFRPDSDIDVLVTFAPDAPWSLLDLVNMEYELADLTNQEQKAAKTTAFDLQLDPANPGLRFHKRDRVKVPNIWSVSVNMDIRLIVHKTDASLMLCYVDHHDKTYGIELDEHIAFQPGFVAYSTMHLAKGLEFRAVVVMPVTTK